MTKANEVIQWIKEYYRDNPDGKAIIGISGGKDSTIAAALCVEALGADRVIGVLMPNGYQRDIMDAREVCNCLEIESLEININEAYNGLIDNTAIALNSRPEPKLKDGFLTVRGNSMIRTNLPARLRMATLYTVAAIFPNSRVVNTCNRSEDYVGYSTKFGDAAGDFSPLGNLTVREVLAIGVELGLPEHLVLKTPSDGMCGKTDEDNLGFTYEQLDNYILGTGAIDVKTVAKIEQLHKATRHKYQPMPTFSPDDFYALPSQMPMFDPSTFDYTKQQKRGLLAEGGLIDDHANINLLGGNGVSGSIGAFTIEPIYHSAPNLDNVNQKALADAIQKVINTSGCEIFKENKQWDTKWTK